MQLLQKLLDIKSDKKPENNIFILLVQTYMINAASQNELKLLGG